MNSSLRRKSISVWSVLSCISFGCGVFTFFKGIDKMTNYYNNEYSVNTINAYVGGDAYNYIINGNYTTAFFVLTAMFVLASIGLIIVHYVSKNNIAAPKVTEKVVEKSFIEDIETNLPEL